jgi:thioredoxin reductase (NADPH)
MSGDEPGSVVRVIGFRWQPGTHEVKDYLARNRIPYYWMDVETSPAARRMLEDIGVSTDELPLVVFPDGTHLSNPNDAEVAEKIGLSTEAGRPFYDLVVVGAGPAGMAAAVYAASEGVRTLVVEREAPGGQAGMSAMIETDLGFPGGLSGAELAERAMSQAAGFGVEVVAARGATAVREDAPYRVVELDDGTTVYCHAVLLAVGVSWRVLEAPGCRDLIGRGVYYGAASAEAASCRDQDVYLIGGGNAAGQAAMELARYARTVTLVAPEPDFAERMSEYLLDRLRSSPNVRFRPGAGVSQAAGDGRLESITIEDLGSGDSETVPTAALFVFIGAQPVTSWLEGVVARDGDGYLLSGAAATEHAPDRWAHDRDPFPLETSMAGVFVAGDARSGSVKRIGAAVGEGASAVQFIHQYLREQ